MVHNDADASIFRGDDYHVARIGKRGMLDEGGGQLQVDDGIGFLGPKSGSSGRGGRGRVHCPAEV